MKDISRRGLFSALSGSIKTQNSVTIQETTLSESEVFSLETIPPSATANGGKRWDILHGVLATGEKIALHESLQPAGAAPNPAHTIRHSEFIFLEQGTLLFEHDSKSETVNPGGVIFVSFGTDHAVKNVGDRAAKYLVVAIGGDTK